MPDQQPTPNAKPKRIRRAALPTADATHHDLAEAAGAMRDVAKALKPLEQLVPHVPTLIEMVRLSNAVKTGGKGIWRAGEFTGAIAKWITVIGGAFAFIWLLLHAKYDLLVKALAL